jgi:hypothetical protein
MAANFGGKLFPRKVQKTIYLSFLVCASVCSSWCLFCRLIVLFCLLVWDPGCCRGNTEQILDQLRCSVTSIEVPSTTHRSMCLVPYHTGALPWPSKWPASEVHLFLLCFCLFEWDPGGRQGNTERILDQLWRSVT